MDTLQSLSVAGQSLSTVLPQSAYQTSLASPTLGAGSRSLLFIDAGVQDAATLLQGVQPGTEVYQLRSGEDAIAQITQTLLGQQGISSLHIISHGQDGELDFANGTLNLATLPSYVNQIRSWGDALTADADILLYGCNVAQDGAGKTFVNLLAQVTGADVAASDDLTGNSALGGDWDLEVYTGAIESDFAFTQATRDGYVGILPINNAPVIQAGNRVYRTSIDGSGSFESYNTQTNTWTNLGSVTTTAQLATDSSGSLYMLNSTTNTIQRYNYNNNTWTDVFVGPSVAINYGNLEVTNSGQFVVTQLGSSTLYYTNGGVWNSYNLPGGASALGDYEAKTGTLVIGADSSEVIWKVDLANLTTTSFTVGATTNTAEIRRAGDIYNGSWYSQYSGSPITSFNLSNSANALQTIAGSPDSFYMSSTVDESNGLFYLNAFGTTQFVQWNPVTNTITSLADALSGNGHNTLAFGSGAIPSFAENGTGTVYTVTATDPDAGATLTYSITGIDANLFNIDSSTGAITFKTAPNFEAPADNGADNVYDITVTVSDGTLSDSEAISISVTNVNEAPSVTSGATASFAENATGTVYTATATDPDAGTTFTYSLTGTDAGLFNIDSSTGAVTFKTAPNFEAPADNGGDNVYDINVTASDGSLSASQAVAITVTNVNEAPSVTSGATASFAENATGTVYTATATDPDAGTTFTYSLTGTDAALFNIDSSTGAVTFKTAPNFEAPADNGADNVYDINVTASDGSLTDSKAVAIIVTDVNDAPSVTSGATASFAENATGTVYTATATDPDAGTTFTYSLTGTDAALFNIDSSTGAVTFKTVPNFEAPADNGADNVYDINVTASDGSLSASQAVAITVTNVNEAPSVTSGATASFAENGTGTVYTATATDPDAGTTFTYSLTGTDAALFNIDSSTGAVTFKTAPNFEAPADNGADNVYDINVTASDGSLTDSKAVAIIVTDANDAPTLALTNTVTQLAENSTIGSGIKVADLNVTDDALGTNTLSLSGADASSFQIQGKALYYIGASPNFEAKNQYNVTVNVDDTSVGATPDQSQNFTLNITDVNEAPTALALTNTVTQLATKTTVGSGIKVADITITDDALGTNTLSLSGADAASFQIQGNALYYIGASPNFATKRQYNVTVNVDDASVGTTPDPSQSFTLNITNPGASDIFWRNPSGGNVLWRFDGETVAQANALPTIVDPNWIMKGRGDFNQDGQQDMLWQHKYSGELYLWAMNGTQIQGGQALGVVDSAWSLQGMADFNNDGRINLLWRHRMGDLLLWQMNAAGYSSSVGLGKVSDTNWQVMQITDLNNDGNVEILWRNKQHNWNYAWSMNKTQFASAFSIGDTTADWKLKAITDFNGDGQKDILWQNSTTGEVSLWANFSNQFNYRVKLGQVPTDWQIEFTIQLNSQGSQGLFWKNKNTDEVVIWRTSQFQVIGGNSYARIGNTQWKVRNYSNDYTVDNAV